MLIKLDPIPAVAISDQSVSTVFMCNVSQGLFFLLFSAASCLCQGVVQRTRQWASTQKVIFGGIAGSLDRRFGTGHSPV